MYMNYRAIHFLLLILSLLMLCPLGAAKTIFVDDDAIGLNNGTSWANAYTFLQEALNNARFAEKPVEIRVAQGVYMPNGGLVAVPEFDWRTTTFQLINGVTLKGGYAGLGETDPNVRDVGLYETILSGDLNGDDVYVSDPCDLFDIPNRHDNSKTVVTGSNTDVTAVLDGFSIRSGCWNELFWDVIRPGSSPIDKGGAGMNNSAGSPTVINCTFTHNTTTWQGAGMHNAEDSHPTVIDCKFTQNYAEGGGGAMANRTGCNPKVTNCEFSDNVTWNDGGAIYNLDNSLTLTNCTFSRNIAFWPFFGSAAKGGGMHNRNCHLVLTNCTFSENSADVGGGIYNKDSNTVLNMCEFVKNMSSLYGGAILNTYGQLIANGCVFKKNYPGAVEDGVANDTIFTNCTFSGNSSPYNGGAVLVSEATFNHCIFAGNRATGDHSTGGAVYSYLTATLNNCTFNNNWADTRDAIDSGGTAQINNCIFWGSEDQIRIGDIYTAPTFIGYSDIQGGWPGEGNIDADPCFADPGYWADVNDPNISVEPNDPNAIWIHGDYHLKSEAGRWDSVTNSWVADSVTSLCIDAGGLDSPVAFEPFANGGVINMGAYGGTAQASKSPSGLHAKYGGGSGEPNEPYLIYTPEHLNTIGLHIEDRNSHFKLMADVDLGGLGPREFNMIGAFPFNFQGVFDGAGHTISNFTYISTDVDGVALFSNVEGARAEIRDLGLIDPFVDARIANLIFEEDRALGNHAGSLVGFVWSGTIRRCCVHGGSISADLHVGGLVAYNQWGALSDCFSTADVAGYKDVGGLVGNNRGAITGCHAIGAVTGDDAVGGLVGHNEGTIRESSAMGDVTGKQKVGGLAGDNKRNKTIQTSFSAGSVNGVNNVGGLVGTSYGDITYCYSMCNVSGDHLVGGLVGYLGSCTLDSCYSTGHIVRELIDGLGGDPWIGGLVGLGFVPKEDDPSPPYEVLRSFWDIETSDQMISFGGMSLTTAEMQTASTFIEAEWDFVDETENGTDDIWWILEGRDYPRLWWELPN